MITLEQFSLTQQICILIYTIGIPIEPDDDLFWWAIYYIKKIFYIIKTNYLKSFLSYYNLFNILNLILIYFINILIVNKFYFIIFNILNKFKLFIKYINILYIYIFYNNFSDKYLNYYKKLSYLNLKQSLMGSGLILLFTLTYIILDFYFQLKVNSNSSLIFHFDYIYDSFNINKNDWIFNIKFCLYSFLYYYISIYILLHIIFGFYNIFYDYFKDSAFTLFFVSLLILDAIFFFLINQEKLNLELYFSILSNYFNSINYA